MVNRCSVVFISRLIFAYHFGRTSIAQWILTLFSSLFFLWKGLCLKNIFLWKKIFSWLILTFESFATLTRFLYLRVYLHSESDSYTIRKALVSSFQKKYFEKFSRRFCGDIAVIIEIMPMLLKKQEIVFKKLLLCELTVIPSKREINWKLFFPIWFPCEHTDPILHHA